MAGQPRRFAELRGVRWRIDLGVLPPAADIPDIRRATADSRRKYGKLRRQWLIDPHDGDNITNLAEENPLSAKPDSTWGQFFRNAELEKTLNQDLSRLNFEIGGFFQTSECQSMLGRILLVWGLSQKECGYRQGMHELLAPLLYVLHNDVQHFYKVRSSYEELFSDDFGGKSFADGVLPKIKRGSQKKPSEDSVHKVKSFDELEPSTKELFWMNDPYGTEGELGILLSDKFVEHDAYCMFENLMSGVGGVVAIADFFSLSPASGSSKGTPIREASSALYHFLSNADSSLHSHLVELGVEPQYFALRWFRVLFGREFSLGNLLCIWDEIFSSPNDMLYLNGTDQEDEQFRILCSLRGILILSIAVSMMLHLRSTLLSSEHATAALQRLLSFPEDVDVNKLLEKAKVLQSLAIDLNLFSRSSKGTNLMSPSNYWEEEWRKLQLSEDLDNGRHSVPSTTTWKKTKSLSQDLSEKKTYSSLVRSVTTQVDEVLEERKSQSSARRSILPDLNNSSGVPNSSLTNGFHTAAVVQKDGSGEPIRNESERNPEAGQMPTSYTSPISSFPIAGPFAGKQISDITGAHLSNTLILDDSKHLVEELSSDADSERLIESGSLTSTCSIEKNGKAKNAESDTTNSEKLIMKDPLEVSVPNANSRHPGAGRRCIEAKAKNDLVLLGTLSQSMMDNIEVLESVILKDTNISDTEQLNGLIINLGGLDVSRAIIALRELRKINNLLSNIRA